MEKVELKGGVRRLPSGVDCIDSLMSGGLEEGILTEIYGEGGSGKSNLSAIFSISAMKLGRKVIFLDTEGFSTERLHQLLHGDISVLKMLMLYRIVSLDDQELSLMKCEKLIEKENVGLLVVDSFTEYFRLEKTGDNLSRVTGMQKQISLLSAIAVAHSIPVLLTNQIYSDLDRGTLQPFGGYVIDHSMKAIYQLSRLPSGSRRITVVKHRSISEGLTAEFRIVLDGVECIPSPHEAEVTR